MVDKMKEITSTTNSLVKETVKLHQKKYRDKLILIEGKKAVEEALKANLEIEYIFSLEKNEYKNVETFFVNEAVMKKISTTESPSSCVAVAKKPKYQLLEFTKFKKIILLENIKDAGNLGTIIRAASAFSVDGIFLFGETVDEFSPKTIRSTAGNMFKIPILKPNMQELLEFKKTHKFIATICHGKNYFDEFQTKENIIVMFGSEAEGISKTLLDIAEDTLTIKLSKNVESLNLALSAGIIMYELQK